jgi:hypothetical protein
LKAKTRGQVQKHTLYRGDFNEKND